jgi:hypothetical protein
MLLRRMVPERGVQSSPVIEALDVVEDGKPRLRARPEAVVIQPFGFERVEETLDDGIVGNSRVGSCCKSSRDDQALLGSWRSRIVGRGRSGAEDPRPDAGCESPAAASFLGNFR